MTDCQTGQPQLSKDEDAKLMEEFAQGPSTMPPIGIDLNGYATEDVAKSIGEATHDWLRLLGKILNLKRLKQVVNRAGCR